MRKLILRCSGCYYVGRGIAPYTNITGKSPSGPFTEFDENVAIIRKSSSRVVLFCDYLTVRYDFLKGAWYLSTVSIDTGVSIGASRILMESWRAASRNSLRESFLPRLMREKSGRLQEVNFNMRRIDFPMSFCTSFRKNERQ